MPYFFGLGLHVLVAIYFAIHAIRRGHNLFWLFVLFSFPLLGSIAYFFVAYLPELRQSRGLHVVGQTMSTMLDPGRGLREAQRAYELTPTINNRVHLADALLENGDAQAALQHYREAAQGPFSDDPLVLRGLARCQLFTGSSADAVATLERLFVSDKDAHRHPDAALLYARALAESGGQGVREAFGIAMEVATDVEPRCRFADWLMAQGEDRDIAQAKGLYRQIIKDSAYWHKYARNHNAEWLQRARATVGD